MVKQTTLKDIDLFNYADYRRFVRDWLIVARSRKGFSLRVFAERAGLGSAGYLKMVTDGKRSLGESGLERVMNGLKLMGEERLYFRNLVLWNQAETDEARARYEGKLHLLRKCRSLMPHIREKIERIRGEIRGLLTSDEFTEEEAASIAGQILPAE